jgi:hypothetical protein
MTTVQFTVLYAWIQNCILLDVYRMIYDDLEETIRISASLETSVTFLYCRTDHCLARPGRMKERHITAKQFQTGQKSSKSALIFL